MTAHELATGGLYELLATARGHVHANSADAKARIDHLATRFAALADDIAAGRADAAEVLRRKQRLLATAETDLAIVAANAAAETRSMAVAGIAALLRVVLAAVAA